MGGMANSAEEPVVDVHRESEVAPENDLEEHEEEDEYVILDLEEVFHGAALPANCAYTLSGLDTMNPVLTLGDDLKLIGEYEETMGTVLVFTERGRSTLCRNLGRVRDKCCMKDMSEGRHIRRLVHICK